MQICALRKDLQEKVAEICDKFPSTKRRLALIEVLQLVQQANHGWLSRELLQAVSNWLNIQICQLYEVVTFYKMFKLQPPAKHQIIVCSSLSCKLCGSQEIYQQLTNKLKIDCGGITPDGKFSLEHGECVCQCDNSPVITVNQQQFHKVVPKKIELILAEFG